MNVLYFAWLKEKIGTGQEEMALPSGVSDVAGFVQHLKEMGDGYAEAFADDDLVRFAVNHEHVAADHPLKEGDEVAFFPPVTGG